MQGCNIFCKTTIEILTKIMSGFCLGGFSLAWKQELYCMWISGKQKSYSEELGKQTGKFLNIVHMRKRFFSMLQEFLFSTIVVPEVFEYNNGWKGAVAV